MAAIEWRFACTAIVGALLLGAACGGNASSDGSGGSGNASGAGGGGNVSGSGGSGNVSGGGGSGNVSGTGGVCAQGAACSTPGAICTPDECCPCSYACEGGTWSIAMCPGCAKPACPAEPPVSGAPCTACDELLEPCVHPEACSTARCVDRKWQVEVYPCPAPPPCGYGPESPPCPPGSLCVYPGGLGDMPYCQPNPCAPDQNVSCDCAGELCTYGYCVNANFDAVWCECPTC